MIVYNVTCNVEKNMAEEWLQWMRTEHIPEVMETGCFLEYKILKLFNPEQDDEGINYAIQYTSESIEKLEHYRKTFGPGLQAKTLSKYGDKVLAYRSVLEVIE
jgi:hypothetical protein